MKKITTFILVFLMVLAVIPITASATPDAEGSYTTVLKQDGSFWAWNWSSTESVEPILISNGIKRIFRGGLFDSTYILRHDDMLLSFGVSDGKGVTFELIPNVETIIFSYSTEFVLQKDGSLWSRGFNFSGQLGDGTTTDRVEFAKILDGVKSMVEGSYQTIFAIRDDDSLWGWGKNNKGQLGLGNTDNVLAPTKIMDGVSKVQAPNESTFVLKTDNTLWACGNNENGQLGDGTTVDKSTFVHIIDNVSAIHNLGIRTFIIKKDKSLWGWGGVDASESDVPVDSDGTTPVKIMDNVAGFSSSSSYFALKTDKTLWAWGDNSIELGLDRIISGVLGDGTTEDRSSPIKIMDNVANFNASSVNMAIKTDNSLWVWGSLFYGEFEYKEQFEQKKHP